MKKTLAVVGASVLGVVGAVASTAAPAQAAPVTDACADRTDHAVTNGTLADNWYMDCVPQYGLGKVDFDLTADEPIPADLLPLEDPGVTSTATTGSASTDYFASTGTTAGFVGLGRPPFSSGSVTENVGHMVFPIESVGSALLSELPAACSGAYTHAYRVEYGAAAVTFSQTVDGRVWTWTVDHTPAPVYLGVNFLQPDPLNPDPAVAAGGFDPATAVCASNGTQTLSASSNASVDWGLFESFYGNQASISPFPESSPPVGAAAQVLGGFNAVITAVPAAPAPAPKPELAATGAVPSGVPWTGGFLLAAGAAFTLLGRRRHQTT